MNEGKMDMKEVRVTVIHPTDGRQLILVVEDDMTGQEFIEALLENNFMVATEDGYQLAIKGGGEIGAEETLASNNVSDGTVLRVLPATDAGA